jgi:hypothetical protein
MQNSIVQNLIVKHMDYFLKKVWKDVKYSSDHLVETDEHIVSDVLALKKLEFMGKASINVKRLEIY